MDFRATLEDFAREQQDDDPVHDALLHIHVGGGNTEVRRGRIAVDDDVVSMWPTVYVSNRDPNDRPRATKWPEHKLPAQVTAFHAEIPLHIRLQNVVMVQWAVNDYS